MQWKILYGHYAEVQNELNRIQLNSNVTVHGVSSASNGYVVIVISIGGSKDA